MEELSIGSNTTNLTTPLCKHPPWRSSICVLELSWIHWVLSWWVPHDWTLWVLMPWGFQWRNPQFRWRSTTNKATYDGILLGFWCDHNGTRWVCFMEVSHCEKTWCVLISLVIHVGKLWSCSGFRLDFESWVKRESVKSWCSKVEVQIPPPIKF